MALVLDSFGSKDKSLVYVTECEEGSDENGIATTIPKIRIRSLRELVRNPEIGLGKEEGKSDPKDTNSNGDGKIIEKSSEDEWETEFQNFIKTKEISCQNRTSNLTPDEHGATFMELEKMPMIDDTSSDHTQSNETAFVHVNGDKDEQGEPSASGIIGSCTESREENDSNNLKEVETKQNNNVESSEKKKKPTPVSVSKRSTSLVHVKRNLEKLHAERNKKLLESSSSKKVKQHRTTKKEKRPLVTLQFAYNDKTKADMAPPTLENGFLPRSDMTPPPVEDDDLPPILHPAVCSPARSDDSQATLPISKFKGVKKMPALTKNAAYEHEVKSKEPLVKTVPKKPKPKNKPAKATNSDDDSFLKNLPIFDLQEEPSIIMTSKGWSAKVDEAVGEMYNQITKGIATFSRMKELMEVSWPYRKADYNYDPDVPTNFRNFPALLDPRVLKEDLARLKNLNWSTFESKLAKVYNKAEFKKGDLDPLINSGTEQLREHRSDSDLVRDVKLLIWAHRKCKGKLYGNLYEQLDESDPPFISEQLTPTIDVRGDLGDPDKKIYVYCERVLVSVAPNMYQAILAAYAMYWLYGITYELSVQPLFEAFDKLSGLS